MEENRRSKINYAVITGASSGIGAEFAKHLAKKGYPLVLIARRKEQLETLSQSLETECVTICTDLSKIDECSHVMEQLKNKKIDIWINNAGFGCCGNISDVNTLTELCMIDLNVKAMHMFTKFALNQMKDNDSGYILNVASSAGLLPAGPYMTTYYATKSYVTSFTRGIAEELRRKKSNIYVGCLCPGPVDTEFNNVAGVKNALKGITARACVDYALKQMFRKRVTIVPTAKMKLAVFFSRFIPTKLNIKIAANQQQKKMK